MTFSETTIQLHSMEEQLSVYQRLSLIACANLDLLTIPTEHLQSHTHTMFPSGKRRVGALVRGSDELVYLLSLHS